MLLTGDQPPSAAAKAAADAHDDVEVRTGARHSYAELLTAQGDLAENLFAARSNANSSGELDSTGEGTQAAPVELGTTGVVEQIAPGVPGGLENTGIAPDVAAVVTFLETDMAGNSIRVGIDPALAPEIGPLGSVSELGFDQSAEIVAELLDVHIEVSFTIAEDRNLTQDANFQGGDEIYRQGFAVPWCTSGFTAQRFNWDTGIYDYGIITAGHCGDDAQVETVVFSMNGVVLEFVSGWNSARADAQFHRIPTSASESHYALDDFFCRDPDSYPDPSCDVTDTASTGDMPGDYVCHNGVNSKISCGTVMNIDHVPTNSGEDGDPHCVDSAGEEIICQGVFVSVYGPRLRACDGDSGGPYYRARIAYGIHKSSEDSPDDPPEDFDDCTWDGQWATFSAIEEVETFLDAQVLTEPVTLSPS